MGIRRLKNSIRNQSTENGEKAAIQRELSSLGHRKGPEVTQGRSEDGRTIRMYLWRSTPEGHVCLVSGPDVEAKVHQLSEVETGDQYGSIYFPAKRGRPALSNVAHTHQNPTESGLVSLKAQTLTNRNPRSFSFLSLGTVLDAVPFMENEGVSEVARSGRGFISAYEKANGSEAALKKMKDSHSGQMWGKRREAFLARHTAQLEHGGWKDGQPTRRHLALVAWAYSPTPQRLRSWLKSHSRRTNGAPGYQSWSWTQEDWRSIKVSPNGKLDFSLECGEKGSRTHSGHPRLCLPIEAINSLMKSPSGRQELRTQARMKARAKPGKRVAYLPLVAKAVAAVTSKSPPDVPRSNPAKGPQAKDLAPIGEYYGKGELFGITAWQPVRFGQILKDLLVNPYDFSDAMAAAVLRYYLKAHGFGKVFKVTTTPGYFNPIKLKQEEMGYIKADGPFGPDFIKAFGFDPPYQSTGFDLKKSTPDGSDLYSDYHEDTPWAVPTESLYYVSALIVSAAAANGLALEPKGAEILAESKAMKGGKKAKAAKASTSSQSSVSGFGKPPWQLYSASLGSVSKVDYKDAPVEWFSTTFGDGSGPTVCMDMAELEIAPYSSTNADATETAFLLVVFCDSYPIKNIVKEMDFRWSKASPKGFAKTFEVPPNTWWRVVYETDLHHFVYDLTEQIVEMEPMITFKTPDSWLDGIIEKVAKKTLDLDDTPTESKPLPGIISEAEWALYLYSPFMTPDEVEQIDKNVNEKAKTFGFEAAKKGSSNDPIKDVNYSTFAQYLDADFQTLSSMNEAWQAGWDLVGDTQKPKVTPQVPAMKGMTPLGLSDSTEAVKQAVFAAIDSLGDAFVEAENGAKKWLDYDSEKSVDYPLQPDPEANYVVIENALHGAKAEKGLYFTVESGTQKGSNPGGIFYGDAGEKYYAKMFGNPFAGNKQVNTKVFIRALNEVIANQLYRMLGLNAPDQRMLIYLDESTEFRLLLFAPWQDGYAPFSHSDLIDFDLNKLLSQFPYDAWTANWDVAGMGGDNLLRKSSSEFPFLRVDQGGALGYRAKGQPKEQGEWIGTGGKVAEIETMLDPSVNADSASKFEGTKPSMWADAIEKINLPFWHAPLLDATLAIVRGAMAAEAVSLQQVLLDEAQAVFSNTLNTLKPRAKYLQDYYEGMLAEPWKFTGEDSPYAASDAESSLSEIAAKQHHIWKPIQAAYDIGPGANSILQSHLTKAYGQGKVSKWVDSLSDAAGLNLVSKQYVFSLAYAAANMGYFSQKKAPAQDSELMGLYTELKDLLESRIWVLEAWNFGHKAFSLNTPVLLGSEDADESLLTVDWISENKTKKLYSVNALMKGMDNSGFMLFLEMLPVGSVIYGLLSPASPVMWDEFNASVGTAFQKVSPKKFEIGYGMTPDDGKAYVDYTGQKNLIPKVSDYIAKNINGMYWYLRVVHPESVADVQNALSDIFGPDASGETPEMDLSAQAQTTQTEMPAATDLLIAPTAWMDLTKQSKFTLQWDSFGEKSPGPTWASMHQDLWETTYKGDRWLLARPKTGDEGVRAWFWSMCLYAEVGARAAPARIVEKGDELWIGLKVPEGYSPGTFESLQKFRPNLSAEYPADAWLANWSVFGPKQNMYENVWVSADGSDYMRVNAQGSLNMRVTGTGKPYPADEIAEISTLLDPSLAPTAALLFSDAKDDPGIALAMATRIAGVGSHYISEVFAFADNPLGSEVSKATIGRAKVMGREIVPTLLPKGLTGAFGSAVQSAKAKATAKAASEAQSKSEAAGALITDGSRVLLVKRSQSVDTSPGYWTIPGGTVDKGESPRKAALREANEELGHVPSPPKMRPAGIEMTATYPPKKGSKKPFTFHTIVFYMDPKTAQTYKPFLEDKRTSYVEETDGWAWVDLDEIQMYDTEDGPRVVWIPKLHSGIADPLPFEMGGEEGALLPLLQLWKDSQQEWNEFAQEFQETALAGLSAEKLLSEGLPFAYGSGPKPKLKNPSGYVLSGVKTDKKGKTYVEYRPKMPDGSRPRRRVSIESVGLGLEQAATEYRMGRKFEHAKASHESVLAAPLAAAVWKWGQGVLSSMGAVLTGLFGDDPTEAQLEGMSLLEAAGLPITEATPQIKEVVKIVEKIVEKEVPVEVVKEIITGGPGAAVAADQLGLPLVQVVGKVKFTKIQKSTIEDLQDALKEILGDSPNPDIGTASQQKLKAKIQSAIQSTKGPNLNTESGVGKYLRILVEAKKAGLWPDIIDPGRRVVYRGLSIGQLSGQKSFTANAHTKAQVKAMLDAGITWSGSDLDAVPKWLKAQSKGTDGQSFFRISDVSPPFYIAVPHSGLVPPGSESEYSQYQTLNNSASQTQKSIPDWAEKRWANVEGFHIDYRNYSHQGDTVSHWTSQYEMGFGSGSFAIRCRADLYDGFVMVPTKTLSGTSYGGEKEVICVDMGVDNPIPAQIVKFNISGSSESLTKKQNLAWMGARPPYPKGYTRPSAPDQMADQSDYVRLQNPEKKGGQKSLFSGAGDYIKKATDAGRKKPPPRGKRSWSAPPPPPLPEKRGAPKPGQPVMTWMVGIPAVGKSTWVAQQLGTNPNSLVIDADLWKEFHPDYDPKHPMRIHRWSRDHVKHQFKEVISDPQPGEQVIVDGTGTYAPDVIKDILKARKAGYYTKLVWVTAPLWLALMRNERRPRRVPENIICRKAGEVKDSFEQIAPYADMTEMVSFGEVEGVEFIPPTVDLNGSGIGNARDWAMEVVDEEFESGTLPRRPNGTQVQSLMFDRSEYSKSGARSWASSHDFAAPATDTVGQFHRIRQHSPATFVPGTFRTISLAPGIKAVIGMPK